MSLRTAVNAMCKACIYQPQSGQGGWRQQVEACQTRTCPLWAYRPKTRGKAIFDGDSLSFPADLTMGATGVAGRVDPAAEAPL